MELLKTNPIEGMQYSSFTDEENPNTFIHINMAKDEETMSKINGNTTELLTSESKE